MKKQKIVDHIFDGYHALSEVITDPKNEQKNLVDDNYALGYLDGYADAMHELGWFLDGEPRKPKERFFLFGIDRKSVV